MRKVPPLGDIQRPSNRDTQVFRHFALCQIQKVIFFSRTNFSSATVPLLSLVSLVFRFSYCSFQSGRLVFRLRRINFSTSLLFQSGRRVSNPQPPAWKAGALPIELLPLIALTFISQVG